MFKFLKKEKIENPLTVTTAIVEEPKSVLKELTQEELVHKIHTEFNTASDLFLDKCKKELDELSSIQLNKDKADRLSKLGFTNTSLVIEVNTHVSKEEVRKRNIESILNWKTKYPLNKFISEEDVKIICGKYGLVLGNVSWYKGVVPEKNLKEIEKFLTYFKERDSAYEKSYGTSWNKCTFKEYDKAVNDPNLIRIHGPWFRKKELMICAVESEMIIPRDYVKSGHTFIQVKKDPVVLQPLSDGGYLIITAWGDEAEDPLVVNEVNN